jgi:hypothetical protein
MGNPMQDETDAMTAAEFLKDYNALGTLRREDLLAYFEERRTQLRSQRRVELHSERHTAKRAPARSTA